MTAADDKSGRRPPSGLSEEEKELWDYVARSIEPARGKPRVGGHEHLTETSPRRPRPSAHTAQPVGAPSNRETHRHIPAAAPVDRRRLPPPPEAVVLERRKARRIARGAEEIDDRLDLHGMTQHAAHLALTGFIRRCHTQGLRIVLVITGKGGLGGSARREDHDDTWTRPRGVLKANVPRWLAAAELAPMVVSYSTAHVRHGGGGALYVHLRRKG